MFIVTEYAALRMALLTMAVLHQWVYSYEGFSSVYLGRSSDREERSQTPKTGFLVKIPSHLTSKYTYNGCFYINRFTVMVSFHQFSWRDLRTKTESS